MIESASRRCEEDLSCEGCRAARIHEIHMTDEKKESAAIIPLDSKSIQEFLEQPLPTIAAILTGALASGRSDAILVGGRILQAAFKGQTLKQVAQEINELKQKGKLKENYAADPLGFKSLHELIDFIDSEAPDEDRLRGMQAMFYAVNSVDTRESDHILMYELFSLAKRLSGSQVRLLSVIRQASSEPHFAGSSAMQTNEWLSNMASRLGHGLSPLVELDESVLIACKLISDRLGGTDSQSVQRTNARLTLLGFKFCEVLKNYDDVKKGLHQT